MLKGDRIVLRPVDTPDIDLVIKWDLDVASNILSGWPGLRSLPSMRARHEKRLNEPPEDLVSMMIEVEGVAIGRVDLGLIDWRQRRGEIGIILDPAYRRKGYGKDAVVTFLQYVFQVKNMHKVSAMCYDFNAGSAALFDSAGFTREGRLRGHEFTTGAYRDMIVFGMLEEEFARLYPDRKLTLPV